MLKVTATNEADTSMWPVAWRQQVTGNKLEALWPLLLTPPNSGLALRVNGRTTWVAHSRVTQFPHYEKRHEK
jgi:hypothetical protein